jgi:hypothetical protein
MPRVRSSELTSRRSWRALALVVVALACVTKPCLAETPTQTVEVTLVGEIGSVPAFPERVTSWFDSDRFQVTVRVVARLDPRSILSEKRDRGVYVWVVLRRLDHARLYFASAAGAEGQTTYLIRDLELEGSLDEIGAENIAQVLNLSAVALLDGLAATRREDVERVLREEPDAKGGAEPSMSAAHPMQDKSAPRTNRAASRRRRIEAEFALGYGVSLRRDEGVWHGPRVGLAARLASGWGLGVLAQGWLPSKGDMGPIALGFYGGFARLSGSFRHMLARGAALEWIVGPGLEVVHYGPVRSLERGVTTGRGDTDARPSVFAGVSGVFRHDSPRIGVTVECRGALVRTRYDVVVGDSRRVIGRAAALVPLLGVEARW